RAAGLGPGDLDAVAVDVGPGLFTGMRVGIATAQGLAVALGIGVYPVRSLDVLAHPFRHSGRPVAAVVDARRGEVFRSLHRSGAEIAPPACSTQLALTAELEALGSCLAVGDGALRHRAELEAVSGTEVVPAMPAAESALELALAALGAGAAALDPADVEALYLRSPDARANFVVLAAAGGGR
ncbi:MAG: tRNA (adenosine(37)-N6)-threonylcarbamoyltransferase complex dimerization subunit type 1 TsaB, partial [Acidimicrobiales bacterium]